MAETEIIMDFPKCYNCGSDKLASQEAWKSLLPETDPPFTSTGKLLVPMVKTVTAVTATLPVVPAAMFESDYCANCGAPRLTRVTKGTMSGAQFAALMGGRAG